MSLLSSGNYKISSSTMFKDLGGRGTGIVVNVWLYNVGNVE